MVSGYNRMPPSLIPMYLFSRWRMSEHIGERSMNIGLYLKTVLKCHIEWGKPHLLPCSACFLYLTPFFRVLLMSFDLQVLIMDQYMGSHSPEWGLTHGRKSRVPLGISHCVLDQMLMTLAHLVRYNNATLPLLLPFCSLLVVGLVIMKFPLLMVSHLLKQVIRGALYYLWMKKPRDSSLPR